MPRVHHPLRLCRPFCPCSSRRGVVAAHLPSNPRAPSRPPSQARGAQRAKEHICSTPLRESLFGHILIPRSASPHYVCEPSCPCSLPSERSICAMRVGHHVQQDPHWYLRSDGSLLVKPHVHQGISSLCTKASAGAKGSTGGSFCPCSPASMRFKGCPGPPCGAPGDSRHDLCREHLAYGVRSRGLRRSKTGTSLVPPAQGQTACMHASPGTPRAQSEEASSQQDPNSMHACSHAIRGAPRERDPGAPT